MTPKTLPPEVTNVFSWMRARIQEKTLVTSGGRVFGVTAQATDIEQARNRVYQLMENIKFRGMQFRSDIGAKAL